MNNETMAPALRVAHLKKSYRDDAQTVDVLRDVTFELLPGETAAVLGASGSGKSTLLHILGGLDVADGGTVEVGGSLLGNLSERALGRLRNEKLGFVYQFHHLLPEFTALDNAAMPLMIRRIPQVEARKTAARMLEAVGLEGRLDHLPSQLSGGERQRVAIARALVTRPACVLADEPTGNLDRDTALAVFSLFVRIAREEGTAVLIVTHDRELAALCDRTFRLDDGTIREE